MAKIVMYSDWAYDYDGEYSEDDISIMLEDDYRSMIGDLKGLLAKGNIYVISGTFGRWNGPQHVGYIVKEIDDLTRFLDFDGDHSDIFESDNGEFKIIQHHHDGTNYYVMRKLTKRGLLRYYNHVAQYGGADSDLFTSLIHVREYTKKADIPKELGWA